MSSLGEHLRETVSDNALQPKEAIAEEVVNYLKSQLKLSDRPETTVTSKIADNQLEIVVADPTAAAEIRIFGPFSSDKEKHRFTVTVGEKKVCLLKTSGRYSEMGPDYLVVEACRLPSPVFGLMTQALISRDPFSGDQFRSLVADALGAPAPSPHLAERTERMDRPHLEDLNYVPPRTPAAVSPEQQPSLEP